MIPNYLLNSNVRPYGGDCRKDRLFTEVFDDSEIEFLYQIGTEHSEIIDKFAHYLRLKPEQRRTAAFFGVASLERSGWIKRGINGMETVGTHQIYVGVHASYELTEDFIDEFYPETPTEYREALMKHLRLAARLMGIVHDDLECILGDFTSSDNFPEDSKIKLELLAARVVYADNEVNRKFSEEYTLQKTPLSWWVYDCDKIDSCYVALQAEAFDSSKLGVFDEFAKYYISKLKTNLGRNILEELISNKDKEREGYKEALKPENVMKRRLDDLKERIETSIAR